MGKIWTIQACLDWSKAYLERHGDERPRLSAEWLLGAAVHMQRIELYMNFDKPMGEDELAFMHDAIVRRGKGEPLQYITGRAPFRMLEFNVKPGVLIPRPETELLVEEVLSYLDESCVQREDEPDKLLAQTDPEHIGLDGLTTRTCRCARVLEVGTGTGCIACSIASERPGVEVVAIDIDAGAAELATKNRDELGLADVVDIRQGDLCAPVREDEYGTFDVLVSNPPYIPSDVMEQLPQEVVAFEPDLALHGGSDGLDIYRRLLEQVPSMVRPGGLFACELHETMLEEAVLLASKSGMEDVRIINDLAGRPRHIVAFMPQA